MLVQPKNLWLKKQIYLCSTPPPGIDSIGNRRSLNPIRHGGGGGEHDGPFNINLWSIKEVILGPLGYPGLP